MAVKLRLKRMGSKRKPYYRVVASDARSPRDGRFIEVVGTYNPVAEPAQITMKEEKVMYWLSNGAIPTDTVKNLLTKTGMLKKFADSKVKTTKKEKVEKKAPAKKTTTAKKTTKKEDK